MSEQMLTLLKFGLLALLYLFFMRTLWAVWSEVRKPAAVGRSGSSNVSSASSNATASPSATAAPKAPAAPPVPAGPTAADRAPAASPKSGTALPVGELVVIEPEAQAGKVHRLGQELTLGRAPGCGISVDDTFVSQLHARVYAANSTWMVEDLGSTNGTFFNGDQLSEPRVVRMGDRIRVGSTLLELR